MSPPLPDLRATFFLPDRLHPDPAISTHGVVLDVPLDGGVDTLAAYADGTARYINHNGGTIIWEVPDADNPMRPHIDRLLTAASKVPLPATHRAWKAPALDDSAMRATVLTRTGLVTTILGSDRMSKDLIDAGIALMAALIDAVPPR